MFSVVFLHLIHTLCRLGQSCYHFIQLSDGSLQTVDVAVVPGVHSSQEGGDRGDTGVQVRLTLRGTDVRWVDGFDIMSSCLL